MRAQGAAAGRGVREAHRPRPPTAYHADMFAALASGRIGEYYEALVVSDDELERGVADGRLVVDTRLRDALRAIAAGRDARVPDPDARRGRRVRGRGGGARRGRRGPAPAAARRARAPAPDRRAAPAPARVPEALAYGASGPRPRRRFGLGDAPERGAACPGGRTGSSSAPRGASSAAARPLASRPGGRRSPRRGGRGRASSSGRRSEAASP